MADRVIQPGAAVSVQVSASAANLGPGFDSVGLALGVWDEVHATVTGDRLQVAVEGEACADVPLDESHLVVRSMHAAWERLGVAAPDGLRLRCVNAVPHSRGLGSSAAAIVAGVSAAAALAEVDVRSPQGRALVNDIAGTLEGHPDNSSASVYGGVTLSWADEVTGGWRTTVLRPHPQLQPVVLVPQLQLATHQARAALPVQVPLADAAANSGRAALLSHALTHEPDLLLPATRDWLHQEARRTSYPVTMAMVDRLRTAGHAATVSGAGPAVLVLATRHSAPAVRAIAADHAGWLVLEPQIPDTGLRVVSHDKGRTV